MSPWARRVLSGAAAAGRCTVGPLRAASTALTYGLTARAGLTAIPEKSGINFSIESTAPTSVSPGTVPGAAAAAAAPSPPTLPTRPHPCLPARCAAVSEHDPAAWAEALERMATVFVGAGWTNEAWDLMAAAGSLRMKDQEVLGDG